MSTRESLAVTSSFVLSLALASACSSNKAPATPITGLPPDAGDDAGFAAPPPDAGVEATGPAFFTDAGTTAPPASTDTIADSAIDLAIGAAAPSAAPKMAEEGEPGRATLKEGEHFAMVVTLQPNRCYTFIAFSPPGNIAQLDLKLLGIALAIEAGKSGPADKAAPGLSVMGKGTAGAICPILPLPVPYKVDVAATKGAGRMGVKVFSRAK